MLDDVLHDLTRRLQEPEFPTKEIRATLQKLEKSANWKTESCAELTRALVESTASDQRIQPDDWGRAVTDMATTGGLMLKSSILVSTWLAADGFGVPKIASTGRHKTGTIDLLRSLGLRTDLSARQLRAQVGEHGLAFCDQTHFAPRDADLMTLRRETHTMDCAPLVISSILAKKMAVGLRRFCVEVRAGQESKFGDYKATVEGARRLVEVADSLGLEVLAVVSNGDLLTAHSVGAEFLADEVRRHLEGYPEVLEGEFGWVWDGAHRQALELFALARWWGGGGRGERPNRAWLREQVGEAEAFLKTGKARDLFEKVACLQGAPLPLRKLDPGESSASIKAPDYRLITDLRPAELKSLGKELRIRVDPKTWQPTLEVYERDVCGPYPEPIRSELPGSGVLGGCCHGQPEPLALGESLLVATVGMSPGIVSEAVDALAAEGQSVDRVVAVHTHNEKAMKELLALALDLKPRTAEDFPDLNVEELILQIKSAKGGPRIPSPASCRPAGFALEERLPIGFFQPPMEDLTNEQSNNETFALLNHVLYCEARHRDLWKYSDPPRVLTAGGRKTMSALAYFSAMLFDIKEALHVLVHPPDLEGLSGPVYHLPPENVVLVRMPKMQLGALVKLVSAQMGDEAPGHQMDADRWKRLADRAEEELKVVLAERGREEELERSALERLQDGLNNPLLPPKLRLALVQGEGDLLQRLGEKLGGVATIESLDDLPDDAAQYDAILVANQAHNPNLLRFVQSWPIPLLAVTDRKESKHRAIDRFLYQRSHAFHWVDASTLRHLYQRLADLVDGMGGQRCPGNFEVDGNLTPEDQKLIQQLFAGRIEGSKLTVERPEGTAGWSGTRRYWVQIPGKPRRYLIKVAPYQSAFEEYHNYQRYIREVADNYCGRIDWFPAREANLSAIAYTEIGSGQKPVMLSEHLNNRLEQAGQEWSMILQRLETFHQNQSKTMAVKTQFLNRYLPTRYEYAYRESSTERVRGQLVEVKPGPTDGQIQLICPEGFKVNVKGIPLGELGSLRLHLGRHLDVPAGERVELWTDLLGKAAKLGLTRCLNLTDTWQPLLRKQLAWGVIHGDLNLDNVMVEYSSPEKREVQQIWWVDFAATGLGPLLFDYAKLEIELWTHIGSQAAERAKQVDDVAGLVRDLYRGKLGLGELMALKRLLDQVHKKAQQHDHGVPLIFDRFRAVYALNTLKYSNLDDLQKRIGAALCDHFWSEA